MIYTFVPFCAVTSCIQYKFVVEEEQLNDINEACNFLRLKWHHVINVCYVIKKIFIFSFHIYFYIYVFTYLFQKLNKNIMRVLRNVFHSKKLSSTFVLKICLQDTRYFYVCFFLLSNRMQNKTLKISLCLK